MTNDYEKYVKGLYEKVDKFQFIEKDTSWTSTNEEFSKHFKLWNYFDYDDTLERLDGVVAKSTKLWTPGKVFLYEKLITDYTTSQKLYYPKIGLYLNSLPCDQTVEVEWVDWRRTWEYNKTYEWTNDKGEIKTTGDFSYLPTQVQSLPIWHDYLLIYGVWDKLPSWKELRKHYERTWWFHKTIQDKRDITINKLING
jgi:hypothetical protein